MSDSPQIQVQMLDGQLVMCAMVSRPALFVTVEHEGRRFRARRMTTLLAREYRDVPVLGTRAATADEGWGDWT